MTAIAVDDEELALGYLVRILKEAKPGDAVHGFTDPQAALEFLSQQPAELAFLDIEMYGLNGIELAKRCKDLRPNINIVFVTGFPEYALDAFSLHASGYLLKPVSVDGVLNEIANLRTRPASRGKRLVVHTFGNFEVFYDNKPLDFGRGKAKELFAFLIDRQGAGCTTAELCAILWEDKEYNLSLQKQFQTIVSELLKTLRRVGVEDVILKKRNHLSVDSSKLDCDYYQFLHGDVHAINAYTGEYMTNYSWAEFTTGFLYQLSQR